MVKKLKAGLDAPVDMSAFVIKTRGREVRPYNGESVWLEPYMDSRTEMKLAQARDELGDNPDNTAAFAMLCEVLCSLTLDWDLTDKYGDALPKPTEPAVFEALPAKAILFLINEALGTESEGEGRSG